MVEWASEAILAETPARTVAWGWEGASLLRQGVILKEPPAGRTLGEGPIAQRAQAEGRPLHLPTLQNLPGRSEFMGWIPDNTQALVVCSVGEKGTLLVGADRARAFTEEDLTRLFLILQPTTGVLQEAARGVSVESREGVKSEKMKR